MITDIGSVFENLSINVLLLRVIAGLTLCFCLLSNTVARQHYAACLAHGTDAAMRLWLFTPPNLHCVTGHYIGSIFVQEVPIQHLLRGQKESTYLVFLLPMERR